MKSNDIAKQIEILQRSRIVAEKREEISRCKLIFGDYIKKNYSEELFGDVARVYVIRAFKREDLCDSYLPDHDWIRLWHEYEPDVSLKELYQIAQDYLSDGCGISG